MKLTQEQVIAWAREAGFVGQAIYHDVDGFLQFATLAYEAGRESIILDGIHTCHDQCDRPTCVAVREAYEAGRKDENEACVEICQKYSQIQLDERVMRNIDVCVDAIRARREQ